MRLSVCARALRVRLSVSPLVCGLFHMVAASKGIATDRVGLRFLSGCGFCNCGPSVEATGHSVDLSLSSAHALDANINMRNEGGQLECFFDSRLKILHSATASIMW